MSSVSGGFYGQITPTRLPYSRMMQRASEAYAFLIPWSLLPLALGKSPTTLVSVVYAILWFGEGRKGICLSRWVSLWTALLAAWMLISVTWSFNPAVSLQATASFATKAAIALLIADVARLHWEQLLRAFFCGGCLLGLTLVALRLSSGSHAPTTVLNVDENATAEMLSVVCAAGVGIVLASLSRRRSLALVGLSVAALGCIATGSRTGWVALVAVSILGAVLAIWHGRFRLRTFLSVLGLAFAVYLSYNYLLHSNFVPDRLTAVWSDIQHGRDSNRSEILSLYLEKKNEWMSIGVGAGADADFLMAVFGQYLHVHNQFWKEWVELGVPGLAAFLLWLGGVLGAARRTPYPSIMGLLLTPVFLFAWTLGGELSTAFWFCLSMSAGASARALAVGKSTRQGSLC